MLNFSSILRFVFYLPALFMLFILPFHTLMAHQPVVSGQDANLPGITSVYTIPALLVQNRINAVQSNPQAVAACIPFTIDFGKDLTPVPYAGGNLYRVMVAAPGTRGMSVHFDVFQLPRGGWMKVYNTEGNELAGPYTSSDNNASRLFATRFVFSDTIFIEYFHPLQSRGSASLRISEIACYFADPGLLLGGNPEGITSADSCRISINCSPEGDKWQDEKRGIVRIALKNGNAILLATGSLINNTSQDCTPFVLTSDNCGNGASWPDLKQSLFYFNYEIFPCGGISNVPVAGSVTGCTKLSSGGIGCGLGSDFFLVELDQPLPASFNPYYLGWSRTGNASDSGVSIHQPAGYYKTVSTYSQSLLSGEYGGGVINTHWKVFWSPTANGHTVMHNGSTGAPLLDTAGRIIGTFSGGYASCSNPTAADYFGKFSVSWDQNGAALATRLREWLDPQNTGQAILDGMYCNTYPPTADFSASTANITAGDSIIFTDLSLYGAAGWQWSFPGGSPRRQ